MILTAHGFRNVHDMTESHAEAILKTLLGVKQPPIAQKTAQENPNVKTTRWVSAKKAKK